MTTVHHEESQGTTAISTQPSINSSSLSQPATQSTIDTVVSQQPTLPSCQRKLSDQVSYADSDAHAQQFYCCLMRGCKACCAGGEDKRWYYPWDKGPLCCLPLGCGWLFVGLLFPCCICIPTCRNIICCVEEGAWAGTCFGACICGIPRDGAGRKRSNSEDSD